MYGIIMKIVSTYRTLRYIAGILNPFNIVKRIIGLFDLNRYKDYYCNLLFSTNEFVLFQATPDFPTATEVKESSGIESPTGVVAPAEANCKATTATTSFHHESAGTNYTDIEDESSLLLSLHETGSIHEDSIGLSCTASNNISLAPTNSPEVMESDSEDQSSLLSSLRPTYSLHEAFSDNSNTSVVVEPVHEPHRAASIDVAGPTDPVEAMESDSTLINASPSSLLGTYLGFKAAVNPDCITPANLPTASSALINAPPTISTNATATVSNSKATRIPKATMIPGAKMIPKASRLMRRISGSLLSKAQSKKPMPIIPMLTKTSSLAAKEVAPSVSSPRHVRLPIKWQPKDPIVHMLTKESSVPAIQTVDATAPITSLAANPEPLRMPVTRQHRTTLLPLLSMTSSVSTNLSSEEMSPLLPLPTAVPRPARVSSQGHHKVSLIPILSRRSSVRTVSSDEEIASPSPVPAAVPRLARLSSQGQHKFTFIPKLSRRSSATTVSLAKEIASLSPVPAAVPKPARVSTQGQRKFSLISMLSRRSSVPAVLFAEEIASSTPTSMAPRPATPSVLRRISAALSIKGKGKGKESHIPRLSKSRNVPAQVPTLPERDGTASSSRLPVVRTRLRRASGMTVVTDGQLDGASHFVSRMLPRNRRERGHTIRPDHQPAPAIVPTRREQRAARRSYRQSEDFLAPAGSNPATGRLDPVGTITSDSSTAPGTTRERSGSSGTIIVRPPVEQREAFLGVGGGDVFTSTTTITTTGSGPQPPPAPT